MKILIIAKRQYMTRDLIGERFGRYWELPYYLGKMGHEVHGFCLSYENKIEDVVFKEIFKGQGNLVWSSFNVGTIQPFGIVQCFKNLLNETRKIQPDIIFTASDPMCIVFAAQLSRKLNLKSVCDVYDNLETYSVMKIPGVKYFFSKAIARADGITSISEILKELLKIKYSYKKGMGILENGVELDIFSPGDRLECRRKIGLPEDAQIIGTAGALYKSRGISLLFEGFRELSKMNPRLYLALTGPCDCLQAMPLGPRVKYFGNLPRALVPVLIGSLDVGIICNRVSDFGVYSFPQKTYEMLACRVPLAVAAVGVMPDLFKKYPQCLFKAEDLESFIKTVKGQLENPVVPEISVPSWEDSANRLNDYLLKVFY